MMLTSWLDQLLNVQYFPVNQVLTSFNESFQQHLKETAFFFPFYRLEVEVTDLKVALPMSKGTRTYTPL